MSTHSAPRNLLQHNVLKITIIYFSFLRRQTEKVRQRCSSLSGPAVPLQLPAPSGRTLSIHSPPSSPSTWIRDLCSAECSKRQHEALPGCTDDFQDRFLLAVLYVTHFFSNDHPHFNFTLSLNSQQINLLWVTEIISDHFFPLPCSWRKCPKSTL